MGLILQYGMWVDATGEDDGALVLITFGELLEHFQRHALTGSKDGWSQSCPQLLLHAATYGRVRYDVAGQKPPKSALIPLVPGVDDDVVIEQKTVCALTSMGRCQSL